MNLEKLYDVYVIDLCELLRLCIVFLLLLWFICIKTLNMSSVQHDGTLVSL